MSNTLIAAGVAGAVILLVIFWVIGLFNGLVRQRNTKDEAWSGVDVQLKRRHDLVGNLVNAVRGYLTHERAIMEEIAKARSLAMSAKTVADASKSEGMLTQALGKLFAVAENYPQLRSADNVMQLQNTLGELENDIQMARRYYNGTVREYNTRIQVFPNNIFAGMLGFTKADFFEITDERQREAPTVSL